MTARYLQIEPQQEPADLGLDETGRAQLVFNVVAWKTPSRRFLHEVIAVLVAAGVGVVGRTLFASSKAAIPTGDGPFLVVRPTGGTGPVGTHNEGFGAIRRPGAQILVRASTTEAAEAMAWDAFDALLAIRNEAVSA